MADNTIKKTTFKNAELLESQRFSAYEKDIIGAILKDEESYTVDQVKGLLDKFKKRVVK